MKSPLQKHDGKALPHTLPPGAAVSVMLPERLGHLPEHKRRELERIARILFDEFEEAQKDKLQDKEKGGRILKLVLFVLTGLNERLVSSELWRSHEDLAHSASFDSEDKDAPSKPGIKHLIRLIRR